MTRNKTGGAAFPLESDYGSQPGMTLRDYFAGQVIGNVIWKIDFHPEGAAERAYRFADAMIAERAKKLSGKPDLVGTGVQKGIVADAMIAKREKGGE